jgi:hypothetical protein
MMRTRLLTVAALATALAVSAAIAQQQQSQTQRVSGTNERVDGNTIRSLRRSSASRRGLFF